MEIEISSKTLNSYMLEIIFTQIAFAPFVSTPCFVMLFHVPLDEMVIFALENKGCWCTLFDLWMLFVVMNILNSLTCKANSSSVDIGLPYIPFKHGIPTSSIRCLTHLARVIPHLTLALELIDKCVGSKIWVVMKGDKGMLCLFQVYYETDTINRIQRYTTRFR